MITALEGYPGVGKTSSARALERSSDIRVIPEQYTYLTEPITVPQDRSDFELDHQRFLAIERARLTMEKRIVLDRSFLSSIVFHEVMNSPCVDQVREDYARDIETGHIVRPDRVLLIDRSHDRIEDSLRERTGMDAFWFDASFHARYTEAVERESERWNIPVKRVQNDSTLLKLENLVAQAVTGETTIMILAYNAAEHLERCLTSIDAFADFAVRVTVVDNGSGKATADLIDDWSFSNPWVDGYETYRLENNLGFARGFNAGLESCDTKNVVLLNSDCELLHGGFDRLVHGLDRFELLGPVTNEYGERGSAPPFDQLRGQQEPYSQTDLLLGHCLAAETDLLRSLGGFEAVYGYGLFEDFDLCLKVTDAGGSLAVANQVAVHHHGRASFTDNGLPYDSIFGKNRELFLERWGPVARGIMKKYRL